MKKILFVIAAVAMVFATSCKKENINEPVNIPEGSFLCDIDNDAVQNRIMSNINDGMSTMTTIVNGRTIFWSDGDVIRINGVDFTKQSGTYNEGGAYFKNENPGAGFWDAASYEAFYPSTVRTGNATGSLPNSYTLTSGDNNAKSLPMYATCDNTNRNLTFKNICAVLEIKVPVACGKIVLSATESISGAFSINDTENPVATLTGSGNTSITVTGTFAADDLVYVPIPAGAYNNFTVTVYNANNDCLGSKINTNAMAVNANKIYPITLKSALETMPTDAFYFQAVGGSVTIYLDKKASSVPQYSMEYYTTDKFGWMNYSFNGLEGEGITLNAGEKVYFRAAAGNGDQHISNLSAQSCFVSTGSGSVKVGGNIMYLLNGTNPKLTLTESYEFKTLFEGRDKDEDTYFINLSDASDLTLPAETLTSHCYDYMFGDQQLLTAAPATLPALTLADNCYNSMFFDCPLLTQAPTLPAQTLISGCYYMMFAYCHSLSSVTMLATSDATVSGQTQALGSWINRYTGDQASSRVLTVDDSIDLSTTFGTYINSKTPTNPNWTIKTQSGATLR